MCAEVIFSTSTHTYSRSHGKSMTASLVTDSQKGYPPPRKHTHCNTHIITMHVFLVSSGYTHTHTHTLNPWLGIDAVSAFRCHCGCNPAHKQGERCIQRTWCCTPSACHLSVSLWASFHLVSSPLLKVYSGTWQFAPWAGTGVKGWKPSLFSFWILTHCYIALLIHSPCVHLNYLLKWPQRSSKS